MSNKILIWEDSNFAVNETKFEKVVIEEDVVKYFEPVFNGLFPMDYMSNSYTFFVPEKINIAIKKFLKNFSKLNSNYKKCFYALIIGFNVCYNEMLSFEIKNNAILKTFKNNKDQKEILDIIRKYKVSLVATNKSAFNPIISIKFKFEQGVTKSITEPVVLTDIMNLLSNFKPIIEHDFTEAERFREKTIFLLFYFFQKLPNVFQLNSKEGIYVMIEEFFYLSENKETEIKVEAIRKRIDREKEKYQYLSTLINNWTQPN